VLYHARDSGAISCSLIIKHIAMRRTRKSKPKSTVSEAVQRASADALNDWLAQRERPSEDLQAKQARLLKILAKRALN
jgi:hypothetical protein